MASEMNLGAVHRGLREMTNTDRTDGQAALTSVKWYCTWCGLLQWWTQWSQQKMAADQISNADCPSRPGANDLPTNDNGDVGRSPDQLLRNHIQLVRLTELPNDPDDVASVPRLISVPYYLPRL